MRTVSLISRGSSLLPPFSYLFKLSSLASPSPRHLSQSAIISELSKSTDTSVFTFQDLSVACGSIDHDFLHCNTFLASMDYIFLNFFYLSGHLRLHLRLWTFSKCSRFLKPLSWALLTFYTLSNCMHRTDFKYHVITTPKFLLLTQDLF